MTSCGGGGFACLLMFFWILDYFFQGNVDQTPIFVPNNRNVGDNFIQVSNLGGISGEFQGENGRGGMIPDRIIKIEQG